MRILSFDIGCDRWRAFQRAPRYEFLNVSGDGGLSGVPMGTSTTLSSPKRGTISVCLERWRSALRGFILPQSFGWEKIADWCYFGALVRNLGIKGYLGITWIGGIFIWLSAKHLRRAYQSLIFSVLPNYQVPTGECKKDFCLLSGFSMPRREWAGLIIRTGAQPD